MYSTKEVLKNKASELFIDGLAQSIAEQIESDAQMQAELLPSTAARGAVVPHSLSTLFLADRFYKKLEMGKFSGRLSVTWNGMDSFIYLPSADMPFTYTTSIGRVIMPKIMETDGGSIPRILRGLKKYSSWGYAPAFIVHDWLFAAKKCKYQPDTDWSFPQAAEIMAEALKTLMEVGYTNYEGRQVRLEKAEDTLYLMYQAVNSFVAEDIWLDDSSAKCLT
jgi:hypothetical protein